MHDASPAEAGDAFADDNASMTAENFMNPTAADVFADTSLAQLADAAVGGDRETITRAAGQCTDLNARGDRGVTVLHWAFLHRAEAGMQELVRLGVDPSTGDDVGNTVMHYAAACDVPALLDALLAAGVSPEVRHARTHETPLFTAIMHDREPQFQALLAAGADVNAADANENRPIHVAAKVNDVVRVERLLEAGADPLVRNYQGVTFQRY